jgi:predicted metal-binding membrane protein
VVVLSALAVLTALAWLYIVVVADAMRMGGMDMPGFRMLPATESMMVPAGQPWLGVEFILVFVMWAVMMAGMMMPSAAPMILLYAKMSRHAEQQGRPLASAAWFTGGYILVWCGFSLLATAAHWGLERALLLSPEMDSTSTVLTALLLIGAGLYQWSPLKDACLRQCQAPWLFIQNHGGIRPGWTGALALGLHHGVYCVGCCWALMALLFAGGVMNVLWIAALSILVLAEKLVPLGRTLPRAAGIVMITSGLVLLVSAPLTAV